MHFSPEHLERALDILFVLFLVVSATQLIYTFICHGSLLIKTKPVDNHTLPPVSVIVCARNEADNLYKNLSTILTQDYPEFEVIVVNHQSIDDSKYILHAFKNEFKNLKVIEITRNQHMGMGKKLPLSVGIKGAKYEHLLLTDADCKPNSDQWIKHMTEGFSKGKELVLGYSPYLKEKGLLNRLIRFDTTWVGMNYLGTGRIGLGYMAVGRNFAYKKDIYEAVHGFKSHYSVLSGDDDLFFQEVSKKGNHTICIHEASFCHSNAESTWEGWVRQKKRHLSASHHYKVIKKLLLGTYPLSLLLMLLSFVILLNNHPFQTALLSVFGGVFLVKWLIQARCFAVLKEKHLAWGIPLFELLYFLVIPVILLGLNSKKGNKWR